MNPELNRLSDLLNESVDRGEYAGASVMVIHKGEENYYAETGYADIESGRKIARDTIFRIYSQSKPITGTAAVMNIDRGVLSPRAMVARASCRDSRTSGTTPNTDRASPWSATARCTSPTC